MIPFVNLKAQRDAYRSELEEAEKDVFESGNYIGGPWVHQLEGKLAEFCKIRHSITCGSGTEALTIALIALGLKPRDQVIVPDFTFVAPAECVSQLGAIPRFADIDPQTLQISPKSVERLIGPKTRGIIAVDLFGQCVPYRELRSIANKYGLWLVEDGAQAFGARVQNGDTYQKACTFGDISTTSFYPSKPLGCYGDGGALFTKDDELAEKIRQTANHGSKSRYLHESVGVNSRLDAIQAAVLSVKLRHLDGELKIRRENAYKYDQFFGGIEGFHLQKIATGNESTYAQYTLLVENREAFMEKLQKAEIPFCIHYPMALHREPCFAGLIQPSEDEAWATDDICKKVISLPVCAFTDVDFIIDKLRQVL